MSDLVTTKCRTTMALMPPDGLTISSNPGRLGSQAKFLHSSVANDTMIYNIVSKRANAGAIALIIVVIAGIVVAATLAAIKAMTPKSKLTLHAKGCPTSSEHAMPGQTRHEQQPAPRREVT